MANKKKQKNEYLITKPEQLMLLGSPERLRLFELLVTHGDLTVVELGELMNRKPQALYYHVKKLMSVGLVVVDQVEKSSRRDIVRYRPVAKQIRLDVKNATPAMKDALGETASTLLRAAQRELINTINDGEPVLTGPDRDLFCRRFRVRMDHKKLRRFNRLVSELETLLNDEDQRDDASEFSITLVCSRLLPEKPY